MRPPANDSKTSTDLAHAVPEAIASLASTLQQAGGRAYLVGGSVRDVLLQRACKDLDIEVFGLTVEQLERTLRKVGHVNAVGRSFGVLKWRPRGAPELDEVDVSIPRRDSNSGPGHRGIAVEGDPHMTTDEAARRRDLTVNALMYDIVDQVIVDHFGGLADLEAGILRAVDPTTFLEDPLRALRVAQFAARLGFTANEELLELCRVATLDELPAERVQGEWFKLLLKSDTPSVGFAIARSTGILERVFPEVSARNSDNLLDILVPARVQMMRVPSPAGWAWSLMLTAWLRGCSPAAVEATLDRLWLHRVDGYNVRERTLAAVAHLDDPLVTDAHLRHLSTHADIATVAQVRNALGDPHACDALARADTLGILRTPPEPLLQGRHLKGLGVPPGPQMGLLLRQVFALQLDGDVQTHEEARAAAQRLL